MSEQQAQGAAKRRIFTQQERDLIRKTVAKDLEPNEFELLMYRAEATGLDPLAKQLYASVRRSRDNDDNWVRNVTIEAQIDGLRLTADRTGTYAPGRETVFGYSDKGELVSATVYGKKLVAGVWHEVSAVAMLAEYQQKTRSGAPNAMWARMPHSQLAKCAEALMLRKGWPADLSGIYTSDEMAQADNEPAPQAAPPSTPPPPAAPSRPATKPEPSEGSDEQGAKNDALAARLNAVAEELAKATGSKPADVVGEYSQFSKDGRLAIYDKGPKKGKPIHFTTPSEWRKFSRTAEGAHKWLEATLHKMQESLDALRPDAAGDQSDQDHVDGMGQDE